MQAVSKIVKAVCLSASILSLTACVAPQPHKTGLQLQAFQAKEFDTKQKVAFAATLSVFQDMGYIIDAANLDTGMITAKSPTENSFVLFVGQQMKFTKASAFIEPRGEGSARIRLNFVDSIETSSGYGMKSAADKPIEDPAHYQEVFNKIQQAIFVRSNT